MSTVKIEEPAVGDYVCIYLDHGWIQIKRESEGVVIDVFDHMEKCISSEAIWNEDLCPYHGKAE